MADQQFYTLITTTGKAKIANATAFGTKVNFNTLKVGDGNGNYYEPTESQTDLVHTVWSGPITSISTDPSNPNWIIIAVSIPADVGGFMIREVGIFDDTGTMIAIGKYPETYKPTSETGSTKDLTIKTILEVSNSGTIELKVDPNIIVATKQDFNALAGTGRTTETVKKNADNIASLGSQMAEKAKQADLDNTNNNVKNNTNELNINKFFNINKLSGLVGISCRNYTTGTWDTSDYLQRVVNAINTYGFNTISIVPNFYQSTVDSNDPGERSPITDDELTRFINFVHSLGKIAILNPHIECETTPYVWRASFAPTNIEEWFTNYKKEIIKYADIAEENGVEMFIIGSEMKSLSDNRYNSYWMEIINNVKQHYSGKISYGINANALQTDEFDTIGNFINYVDFISYDMYWNTSTGFYSNPNKESCNAKIDDLFFKFNNKPILFLEFRLEDDEKTIELTNQKLAGFLSKQYLRGYNWWVIDVPGNDDSFENYSEDIKNTVANYTKNPVKPNSTETNINNREIYGYYNNSNNSLFEKVGSVKINKSYSGGMCIFGINSIYQPGNYISSKILLWIQSTTMNNDPLIGGSIISNGGKKIKAYIKVTSNNPNEKEVSLYVEVVPYALNKHSIDYNDSMSITTLADRMPLAPLPDGYTEINEMYHNSILLANLTSSDNVNSIENNSLFIQNNVLSFKDSTGNIKSISFQV